MLPGVPKSGWLIHWRGDTRSCKRPRTVIRKVFLFSGNGRGVRYYAAVVSGADWLGADRPAPFIRFSLKIRRDIAYCSGYPAHHPMRRSEGVGLPGDWVALLHPRSLVCRMSSWPGLLPVPFEASSKSYGCQPAPHASCRRTSTHSCYG